MKILQTKICDAFEVATIAIDFKADVFFLTASPLFGNILHFIALLNSKFSNILSIICSAAKEISDTKLFDTTLVLPVQVAEKAAIRCKKDIKNEQQLAFPVSCVGRSLVLKQVVKEEVKAVNEQFAGIIKTTSFYCGGEIASFDKFSTRELHNQTMTITTFAA